MEYTEAYFKHKMFIENMRFYIFIGFICLVVGYFILSIISDNLIPFYNKIRGQIRKIFKNKDR